MGSRTKCVPIFITFHNISFFFFFEYMKLNFGKIFRNCNIIIYTTLHTTLQIIEKIYNFCQKIILTTHCPIEEKLEI